MMRALRGAKIAGVRRLKDKPKRGNVASAKRGGGKAPLKINYDP